MQPLIISVIYSRHIIILMNTFHWHCNWPLGFIWKTIQLEIFDLYGRVWIGVSVAIWHYRKLYWSDINHNTSTMDYCKSWSKTNVSNMILTDCQFQLWVAININLTFLLISIKASNSLEIFLGCQMTIWEYESGFDFNNTNYHLLL